MIDEFWSSRKKIQNFWNFGEFFCILRESVIQCITYTCYPWNDFRDSLFVHPKSFAEKGSLCEEDAVRIRAHFIPIWKQSFESEKRFWKSFEISKSEKKNTLQNFFSTLLYRAIDSMFFEFFGHPIYDLRLRMLEDNHREDYEC